MTGHLARSFQYYVSGEQPVPLQKFVEDRGESLAETGDMTDVPKYGTSRTSTCTI
ncbi:MAG: hypothetical protein ACLU4N_01360 [Butyricimonas faecihominis]